MATTPSLKGSVITELVEDVNKLVADGELSDEELERHLTPEDIATLTSTIMVSHWYSVKFYERVANLLRDTVGSGKNEYLRERGLKKGRKLIESGLYQQMEYATRAQVQEESTPEARSAAYGHDLKLFMTLSQSILNFTRWSTAPDPDHEGRHLIAVEGAADYPDALAWATEGLIEAMAETHGFSKMWSHSRPRTDRIVFNMTRSL